MLSDYFLPLTWEAYTGNYLEKSSATTLRVKVELHGIQPRKVGLGPFLRNSREEKQTNQNQNQTKAKTSMSKYSSLHKVDPQ